MVSNISIITLSLAIVSITIIKLVLSPVEPHSAIRLEDDLSGLPGLPLLDLFDEHRDHLGDVTLGELFENLPFARLEEDLCATELVAARRDL